MEQSILTSIKKMLGITEEYEHFDQDLIIHINSALMILTQLGVGPAEGYSIRDKSTTWGDFLVGNNTQNSDIMSIAIRQTKIQTQVINNVGMIQTYIYLKVKLSFDPPQNSFLVDSMTKIINEHEWRLNVLFDNN